MSCYINLERKLQHVGHIWVTLIWIVQWVKCIGVGAGLAGQVLAGPATFIQGKNKISFLQKASNEQKC